MSEMLEKILSVTPPIKLKYLGFGFWKDKAEWKTRHHKSSVERFKKILTKRGLISIYDYYLKVAHI